MKKITLQIILVLASSIAFSQTLEHTERIGWQGLQVTSSGEIFVGGASSSNVGGFYLLENDGQNHFDSLHYGDDWDYRLFETMDGGYIITFYQFQCDLIANFGFKLDSNWQFQWRDNYLGPLVLELGNGDLFNFAGDQFAKFSAEGELLWEGISSPYVSSMLLLPGDTILAAGFNKLSLLDTAANLLGEIPNIAFSDMKRTPDGRIVGFKENSMSILGADLQLLGTTNFFSNIQDFAVDADQIVVLLATGEVKFLDFDFNLTGEFFPGGASLKFFDLALRENDVLLGGWEDYSTGERAGFVKSYAFDGSSLNYGADAGVINASVGSLDVNYLDGLDELAVSDISITIQNFGTAVLDSVWVVVSFPDIHIPLWCPIVRYFEQKYVGLGLLPGQTATVTLDSFAVRFENDNEPIDFNFFAYQPNHKLDGDHSNDAFLLALTVNDRERPAANVQLEIYPNPTAGQLTVQLPAALPADAEMTLRNSYGQVVLHSVFAKNELVKSLDVSWLASGVYFLEMVEMQSGKVWASRVVVAD